MDRTDLELVLAIRQHGSLAGAARALHLAAPVVTKRLAALEAALGLRLFQRTTRHVSPTAEGDSLCQHAAQLLQGFAQAEAELRERRLEPAGPVRLAATFGFGRRWVGPALADFQRRHPAVNIQLQLTEHLPDLALEGFDGAIWLWNAPGGRAGEWVSRKLAANQRVLVAAPGYLAQHGTPSHPDELRQHACLVVRENGGWGGNEGGATRQQRFDHWRLQPSDKPQVHHIPVTGPLSSNSGEMVRDWCLEGHGIMLRSLWDIAPQLASGALVRVLPGWSMPDADVHWLAPYRAQVPRRIRLLVDFLAQRLGEAPWEPLSAKRAPPGSRQKR
ncbi:MAG: LysR substrate-binding domain-containing protein [Hydrogenophaga sp.]|nr:LysR substrate-binding domain-containing protein [Hydrogenophaga sp.]